MTQTSLVQNEIERFLRSDEPEVLCITGEWGVGKTFNWQMKLDALRAARAVGLKRYSYVSLFGLNSLAEIKQSIFENMEFLVPDGQTVFERGRSIANKGFQYGKGVTAATLSAIPHVGDALSKAAQPLLFSSVRGQIICIDDLERRGAALSVKDVFGIISFLREQRNCKVCLLLNEAKITDTVASQEFKDYFEKTIDAKVVFAPTSVEAVKIAFPGTDRVSRLLSKYGALLQVKNIRVLKKIERLVSIVMPVVEDLSDEVTVQTVHSLVLFGWCQFDTGAEPPPIAFLRTSSLSRYLGDRKQNEDSKREDRWDTATAAYGFNRMDDYDFELAKFVESSVLNFDELRAESLKQQASIQRSKQTGSFQDAFRNLHDSFRDDEDEVCNNLVDAVKNNIEVTPLSSLDEVVTILSRLKRGKTANDLIDYAVKTAGDGFWKFEVDFNRPLVNDRLKEIVAQQRKAHIPPFDFERDLLEVVQTRNADTFKIISEQPVEKFVSLFQSKTGAELRAVLSSAFASRRISNASEEEREIERKAEAALRKLAKTSEINSLRASNWLPGK